jgi:hypothetical protein
MSLLGIAGTLASVGAGYADAKSAKERRARQQKSDELTDTILAGQAARLNKSEDLNDRFRAKGMTAGGPSNDEIMANQADLRTVDNIPDGDTYARGGMVGYANSAPSSESEHPCYFVDHTWMRESFKK